MSTLLAGYVDKFYASKSSFEAPLQRYRVCFTIETAIFRFFKQNLSNRFGEPLQICFFHIKSEMGVGLLPISFILFCNQSSLNGKDFNN